MTLTIYLLTKYIVANGNLHGVMYFTEGEANRENEKEGIGSVQCWFCALVLGLAFYLPRFRQEHFQFAQIPTHCITFTTLNFKGFGFSGIFEFDVAL